MTTETIRTVTGPAIGDLFGAIGRAASALAAGARASREWERLNAMSGTTLARHGLRREDIARTIMERHFR
jgi:hypothetical protein